MPNWSTRFLEKVKIGGPDECWEWQAGCSGGYGILSGVTDGMPERSHRLAYMYWVGDTPKGKVVMYSCDNRRCCNPKHLSLGTIRDNLLDMYKKGRGRGQFGPDNPPPTPKRLDMPRVNGRRAEEIICDNCGDTFLKRADKVDVINYCSRECYQRSRYAN